MNLPDEVFIEIFSYLSILDLVNLCKIHPRFENIIDTTSKLKCFNLILDTKSTISTRSKKFGKLTVLQSLPSNYKKVLSICGANISIITFCRTKVSFTQICQLLRMCPNVRQLKFENMAVWPEVVKELPQLDNLIVDLEESSVCLLDLLVKSRVTALKIIAKEEFGTGIRSFLQSQKTLKSVFCSGAKVLDIFYSMGNSYSENYQALPFHLNILVLRDICWKDYYLDLFAPSFNYIRFLELSNILSDLTSFVNYCENLDELILDTCLIRSLKSNKSITKVTLRGATSTTWLSVVEKLQRLRLQGGRDHSFDFDLRRNLHLNEIEIEMREISASLQIPSVKKISLKRIKKLPELLFKGKNIIEEFTISDCGPLTEQILSEAGKSMRQLKSVRISGGSARPATIAALRRNCANSAVFSVRNLQEFE